MSKTRSVLRYIQIGLMYLGANVWPSAEVYHALRAATTEDRVTPYEDLSESEHRLLMALEEQFKRQLPSPRHPTD